MDRPEQIALLTNRSAALSAAGRHEEAVQQARSALDLDPNHCAALFNLATSLLALGNWSEACHHFARCAALSPEDPKVHNNLGLALAAAAQYEDALKSYDCALRLQRNYARALNNRATVLMKLQRLEEALNDLDRAIEIDPGYTRALLNRGSVLRSLGRDEVALGSFERALPDLEALANLTDLLVKQPARAVEALSCATELHRRAPERENVVGTYHAASQALARWSDYDDRVAAITRGIRAGRRAATPFRLLYVSDRPEDQLACARLWANSIPPQEPLCRERDYAHSRIRVGYLSSDFYSHATAHLAAGLFEHHDRNRFECFALSHGIPRSDDPMEARLKSAFEHFEDVHGRSAYEIARRVRALEIDVLVDLKGYTADSQIEVLSYRPAPVQVHYLGYPGTLGASFVDYLIADDYVVPEAEASHYAEQIVRLPYTYQVTDNRRRVDNQTSTREQFGLPTTGLVLAAFHQTYKLNPEVFSLWMRLLRQLPDAYLWLLARNPNAQHQLRAEAARRDVDPGRIIFAPAAPPTEHLSRQRLADLLLDAWPYGSHTTASDALWAGLPVAALSGRTFASRVSGSILRAAGLPDLIANSIDEYEALVRDICTDADRLRAVRRRVECEARSSPLFDTMGFTRALESCYVQMVARRKAGLAPAPINVQRD